MDVAELIAGLQSEAAKNQDTIDWLTSELASAQERQSELLRAIANVGSAFQRDPFLAHYHRRSNVETTFSMIKRKFGEALKSKSYEGQVNEVLCKVVCHNICCLISAMHELNIQRPTFGLVSLPVAG
jgi:hypothetical protein